MIHGALRSMKFLYGAKKRLRSKQPPPHDEKYFQAIFEDSKAQHQSQQGGILHDRSTEKLDVYESQSSSQMASVGRRRCEG